MQIRLTVLGPRGGHAEPTAGGCDVLVTAPPGTTLSAVTSALAAAAAAAGAAPAVPSGDAVTVFAGARRLDADRQMLGVPPLVDGAVVSLYGPTAPWGHGPAPGGARARLHVVAGPDAGGVHLLRGGQVRLGRSAEADVPLDDPDVSRLHCAITVPDRGTATVTDLASTNGTTVDGTAVHDRPVPLPPGATLRLGESAVRLRSGDADEGTDRILATLPDGEGRLRIAPPAGTPDGARGTTGPPGRTPAAETVGGLGTATIAPAPPAPPYGSGGATTPYVPDPARAAEEAEHERAAHPFPAGGGTHGAGLARPRGDTDRPADRRGRGGLGSWARRLAGGRAEEPAGAPGGPDAPAAPARSVPEDHRLPDPSEILLTAVGPGPRLWERGIDHPDALAVRLGTVRGAGGAVAPVAVGLRRTGSLGLAGPRGRLLPLARSVLAQLAALHGPSTLEIVLIAPGRAPGGARDGAGGREGDWSWIGWLPHLRPAHGQDCRLLLAYDHEQAAARVEELLERLDAPAAAPGTGSVRGPSTVAVVDGDPGSAELREAVSRLAAHGPSAGVHLLCLAETPAATPTSPLADTLRAAASVSPAFRSCGAVGLLSGAVATAVRLVVRGTDPATAPVAGVDGVSAAWAERFARALAPLREADATDGPSAARPVPLPESSRLLDELGLARATPAALLARWADDPVERADGTPRAAGRGPGPDGAPAGAGVPGGPGGPVGPRAGAVLGAGTRGPVTVDLAADRGPLLIGGPAGSGKTELLRSLAASLAAGERPDRLSLVLVDGDGDGLRPCGDLPHASTYLPAGDPVRMREFAQALSGELKRRADMLGDLPYEAYAAREAWARHRAAAGPAARVVAQRRTGGGPGVGRPPHRPPHRAQVPAPGTGPVPVSGGPGDERPGREGRYGTDRGTLALRSRGELPGELPVAGGDGESGGGGGAPGPLPRVVVVVDDFDTLVAPALGNPGRPAAGSVVRALEAVARDGARLGVHLLAATGRPEHTEHTAADRGAPLRVFLGGDGGSAAEGVPPGRGVLHRPDGSVTAFQAGRVSGRIPRTATLRPTVVPLDWARVGDPPTRRPVRELGNGPTDLALLASAIERAAREAGAPPPPPLL
ncbi:FHA domain-containing protein [Streptomyces sp. TRM43335]|uniref:FHA domain-containing protein n=1 Tax=Streptomyces taklimakanensis TaxID=2569853 RepID=A0A6G2BAF9_9ACTN|nr:FHA domain-containing protein [Streptomyces taklimakanensis]MTE19265.1 FHA domain-containing protein [Streptomyces taklimakanensis]